MRLDPLHCILLGIVILFIARTAHGDAGERVLRRARRSAVIVRRDDGGVGSGTIIKSDKSGTLILTCAHVLTNLEKTCAVQPVVVVTVNWVGERHVEPAKVVTIDSATDLALIRVAKRIGPAMQLADVPPRMYEHLYAVAAPDGKAGQSSDLRLCAQYEMPSWNTESGVVSAQTWRLSGFAYPGMSGGTVANAAGHLVAVLQGIYEMRDGSGNRVCEISYAVPWQTVHAFLKRYFSSVRHVASGNRSR